jgi:putative phage-type endonuclease
MLTDRELEARRRSLGSSEIGVIAGHSLYRNATPFKVWESKVFGPEPGSSDAMYAGSFFERGIAEWYLQAMGLEDKCRLWKASRRVHPSRRWMSATCDFYVVSRKSGKRTHVVECKFVGPGMDKHWNLDREDGVPDMVRDQVDWQMACSGHRRVDVAAFFAGPREFKVFRFGHMKSREKSLVGVGEEFWFDHVVPQVAPPIDFSEAAARALQRMYPKHGDELVQATPGAYVLAANYDDARQREKVAKEEKDESRNKLCSLIGENAGIKGAWGKATWKLAKNGKVDKEALLKHLLADKTDDEVEELNERFRKPATRAFRLAFEEL